MQNRVTLEQLGKMPIGSVMTLPVEQIAMLLDDVAEREAALKGQKEWLNGALNLRFGEAAQAKRLAEGKDTGTVTLAEDGWIVRADLPKKIEWAQPVLKKAVAEIVGWGESPDEYVTTEIKVAEAKFNAWPSSIRKLFEPGRTVSTGKPTFKVERAKSREAA